MTSDQFRILEEISGTRTPSNSMSQGSKADDLLAAAIAAFADITRPGRQDMQLLEDLALPLVQNATTKGKRHAADALALFADVPRKLVLTLAAEPVIISTPLLLRSPRLKPADLIDIIEKQGLDHARIIARRKSDDALVKTALRSFNDPAIDRSLDLHAELAGDLQTPAPHSSTHSDVRPDHASDERQLQSAETSTIADHERLLNAALLADNSHFIKALSEALELSPERTTTIIGQWSTSYLPIVLRGLGLPAAECFVIMAAVLGSIKITRETLLEFVEIYQSIDRVKAMLLVHRWKADDMSALLRNKLREMATGEAQQSWALRDSLEASNDSRSVL